MESKESHNSINCSMLGLIKYLFSNVKNLSKESTPQKIIENEKKYDCPICFNSFNSLDIVGSDSKDCRHKICWKCYGLAYKSGNPIDKCPICRRTFTKKQIKRPHNRVITPAPNIVQSPRRERRPIDYIDSMGNLIPEFMEKTPEERNYILQELARVSEILREITNSGIGEENLENLNLEITPIEMEHILNDRQRFMQSRGRWM
tara:strand:+ start:1200 stop:1811 length:612 start_codon:yes stop_codon:yes gene_type:complete